MDLKWEWEKKKDSWTRFDENISEKLEEALENDSSNAEIQAGGANFTVDFSKMTQKNKKTGFQRKIRCVIKDSSEEKHYAWEWKDESGTWKSYDRKTVELLEKERNLDSKTVALTVFGRSYTVDLAGMDQENDATGIKRKVRRVESKAEEVESTEGVAVKATRSSTAKRGADRDSSKEDGRKRETADEPPPKRSKAAKSTKSQHDTEASTSKAKSTKRKVVVKGKAPLDPECYQMEGKAHVYFEGNDVYDVMLNQTNLQHNNNKFYLIQLLEDDSAKRYSVWLRWGRVGVKGQNNLISCGPDLEEAKGIFCKKFEDKTKNEWGTRSKFKKVAGKYDLIKVDYSAKEDDDNDDEETSTTTEAEKIKIPDSKLDERIQNLLSLICDVSAMKQMMMEMEYDAEKCPLGKLTQTQIKAGFAALKLIENMIEKKDYGGKLVEACNAYYTRIPHVFGMRKPPLIRDKTMLKKEIELMEALGDIEVAIRTLQRNKEEELVNPIDRQYDSMKCDLTPLDSSSDEFKMVEKYMVNTHAPTHALYRMKPRQVYVCDKEGETQQFNDVGNKMLLWHGSRLTNFYGILSQGLRIAPPEAPVTGYMFGKGLYFADVSSKSANYCFATKQKNVGLVLLCEVALGKPEELIAADYKADKLPAGKHSTKGLGKLGPDPKDDFVMKGNCKVPMGKLEDTGIDNPDGYTLNYNEFVVYDTAQVRMRYLVETEFLFK